GGVFLSSRRRHTRSKRDWSSDVCSSDLTVAQTLLPERWVIVDDGSGDETSEIVGRYMENHPWIELVRRPQRQDRSFASKVDAFKDRKSTRLNSSHVSISYAVFCLKKKKKKR